VPCIHTPTLTAAAELLQLLSYSLQVPTWGAVLKVSDQGKLLQVGLAGMTLVLGIVVVTAGHVYSSCPLLPCQLCCVEAGCLP
jgi:hypothetical protein